MRLAFTRQYPKADFERLCKRQRDSSGRSLQSGHVTYLPTIKAAAKSSKKEAQLVRKNFKQLAADNDWSSAQLHAKIRKKYAGGKKAHGRTFILGAQPTNAVSKAIERASNWYKRGEAAYQLLLDKKGKHAKAIAALEAMIKSSKQWCTKFEKIIGELRRAKGTKAKSSKWLSPALERGLDRSLIQPPVDSTRVCPVRHGRYRSGLGFHFHACHVHSHRSRR